MNECEFDCISAMCVREQTHHIIFDLSKNELGLKRPIQNDVDLNVLLRTLLLGTVADLVLERAVFVC